MKKAIKLSIILLLLTATLSAVAITAAQTTEAADAQTAVQSAYSAVDAAYKAGADTNQLIALLNQAVNLTAQAQEIANASPEQAASLSSQVVAIAQNVTAQANVAQQAATQTTPIIAAATATVLIAVGVVTYFFGPRIFYRIWFRIYRNFRLNARNAKGAGSVVTITAEQVVAVILVATVVVAFISVSGFLLPRTSTEKFSELGIFGKNGMLADYPTEVVASETVHLYGYVGNQMGEPTYYTVMVKLGDNQSTVNPSSLTPIKQYRQVVANNASWTFPVDMTLTKAGDNQRIIFELWIYNQTINQNQYSARWGQLWLNVTAPAS